ncbi:MAG: TonB-dependent receptor [Cyanophyceae cyanobacterium]
MHSTRAEVELAEPHSHDLVSPPLTVNHSRPDIVTSSLFNLDGGHRIAQSLVEIIGVQVNSTEAGVEVILDSAGELASPSTSVVGNALIAEIPNAVLALPEESFEQFDPAAGIALISVTNLPGNRVQVAITGTDTPPTAEVSTEAQGLVLSVTPGTGVDSAEEEAPEIVVTATRTEEAEAEVPRAVTVIPRDEIEDQSLLTNDLSGFLGILVPGFGPPNPEGRTRAQSLRGREALILLDGIPQNSNTSFGTELSNIDPAAIERIEVVRGPSAIYGDGGTGGIVNVITRAPAEEGFEQSFASALRLDLSNLDETDPGFKGQYGLSGRQGRFDFRINGAFDGDPTHFDADGDRIPPDGLSSDNSSVNLLTKLGFNFTETQRLQLTYNLFNNDFESEFISDPEVFAIEGLQTARALDVGDIDYDDDPEQTIQNLGLTYRHEDILGSQLDAQFYYRETDLTQLPRDIRGQFPDEAFPAAPRLFQTTLDSSELGLRLQVDSSFSNSLSLLWGVDYAQEENEASFNALDPNAFDQEREGAVIDTPTQSPFYTLENLGVFAQLQWKLGDRWQFRGGARFENISADVDDYTASPFSNPAGPPPEVEGGTVDDDDVVFNAGLVFDASPNVNLFVNFSQGFSIPQLGITLGLAPFGTSIEDSVELESQKVDNYELGIRGNWQDVEVSLVGFYNESELGSALTVSEDGITQVVRAPQENYGLEFSVDWTPSARWRLGGDLTWNEGDFDPEDAGDFVALSSVDVQPLNLTLYLENETLPGWRNRLQALIVADRDRAFEDEVDEFEIDGYTVLDLISSIEIGAGRLELGIGNLLDEEYLPVSSQERIGVQENLRFAGRGRNITLRYLLDF